MYTMGAQFRVIPPLARVQSLFEAASSVSLHHGAEWSEFSECPDELIEQFRPYIRPSHQQLLNAAIAKEGSRPLLSFLRQLLRPHDFKIEATSTGWRLVSATEEESTAVRRKSSPVKIDWT